MIQHQHHRATDALLKGVSCAAVATLSVLAALVGPRALAFEEIDHGALLLATTAAATYDSDIQGGPNANSDFIYSLYPDLLYKEDQSLLKVNAGAGITFQRYETYTQYNSNDADGHLNMDLGPSESLPLSGTFDNSYVEKTDVDYDLNARVHTKTLSSALNGLYTLSRQLSIGATGSYVRIDRGSDGTQLMEGGGASLNYQDFLNAANVSLQYNRLEASASSVEGGPTLDQISNSYSVVVSRPIYDDIKASATYGYRFLSRSADETEDSEPDADGSYYSVSLDGPFLPPNAFPKLKSLLSISYERATTPGINDQGGNRLVAAAHLTWSATDTTNLGVTADHSQELASNNLTVVSTDFLANVGQDIGHFVHAEVGGGYSRREYIGIARTDNVGTGYAHINYHATKALTVSLNYDVHATSSNDVLASYSRNQVRLSATYTF
jgi:hypothetical protein